MSQVDQVLCQNGTCPPPITLPRATLCSYVHHIRLATSEGTRNSTEPRAGPNRKHCFPQFLYFCTIECTVPSSTRTSIGYDLWRDYTIVASLIMVMSLSNGVCSFLLNNAIRCMLLARDDNRRLKRNWTIGLI
jgi:hypothetical protein